MWFVIYREYWFVLYYLHVGSMFTLLLRKGTHLTVAISSNKTCERFYTLLKGWSFRVLLHFPVSWRFSVFCSSWLVPSRCVCVRPARCVSFTRLFRRAYLQFGVYACVMRTHALYAAHCHVFAQFDGGWMVTEVQLRQNKSISNRRSPVLRISWREW